MDFTEACDAVLEAQRANPKNKALSYAAVYAMAAVGVSDEKEKRRQASLILANIANWKGDAANSVRSFLHSFLGEPLVHNS